MTYVNQHNNENIRGGVIQGILKDKSGVGIIRDYSRDYTVVNGA